MSRDAERPVPLTSDARPEQTFPRLTDEQAARVLAAGRVREVSAGEVLVDEGVRPRRPVPSAACS
jgi:hypothetical protein